MGKMKEVIKDYKNFLFIINIHSVNLFCSVIYKIMKLFRLLLQYLNNNLLNRIDLKIFINNLIYLY